MLYIVKIKSVPAEELIKCCDGEITKMLMIDRVKPAVLDQRLNIGDLHYSKAVVFQKLGDRRGKAICIGDMGKHVIGVYNIGAHAFCVKRLCKVARKERAAGGHAYVLRGRGGAIGGIDTKHGNSSFNIVL